MRTSVVLVCILSALFCYCPSAEAVTLPFDDDFEGYDTGAYPSPPWSQYISGSYAVVSEEEAYSGSKSFKLAGASGWSRSDSIPVTYPDSFSYRVAAMIGSGRGGMVGIAKSWGGASPVNSVQFFADENRVYWEGPTSSILLDTCQRGVWYDVVVNIYGFFGSSPQADVTITYQGNVVTHTGLPAYDRTDANLDLFQLHTSSVQTTMFYDDVGIAVIPEPLTLLGFVTGLAGCTLLRRRG